MRNNLLWSIYTGLLAYSFLPNWWIKKSDKKVLDLGCGKGLPMELIKKRHPNIHATGVEIYEPYIELCKKYRFHDNYFREDVVKYKFQRNSFDVVMALQVIEHLPKKQAWEVIKNMEKASKRLVVISTPIGETEYETDDGNQFQEHKSYFYPNEFEKLGYKTTKIGGKRLFGENGIAHKFSEDNPIRKLTFLLDIFLTPYYLVNQEGSDYFFFAYKEL